MVDLSIPLVRGRGQKTLIKEVRIDSRRSWQAQHWKTIVTCYSGSPWFGFYRDGLEALYRQPADFLMDWDLVCLEWALRALGMTRTIGLTGEYREAYEAEDGFTDWRGRLMPRNREHWEEAIGRHAGEPGAGHRTRPDRGGSAPRSPSPLRVRKRSAPASVLRGNPARPGGSAPTGPGGPGRPVARPAVLAACPDSGSAGRERRQRGKPRANATSGCCPAT